jgi:type VI protein secretion system component Hcp
MPFNVFLKIDGIQGESTDNQHRDEIDILSYTWAWSTARPRTHRRVEDVEADLDNSAKSTRIWQRMHFDKR